MKSSLIKRNFSFALILMLLLAANATTSRAQGILYPPNDVRFQPFYVKDLRVHTRIDDAVAETTVEQTFVNDSPVAQEGTYLYPLPEGASPTAFSMTVGDKTLEPRVLRSDEARSIYESIVRRRRDPALLEYVGRNLVRINVFPIPPHGERLIRLRYTEVLKPEGGLRRYAYPLSTSRFGNRPVGVTSVTITLQTTTPIRNVYSPTHDVSIRRPDDRTATASWEGRNDASDRDLTLYFSTSNDDVGLSLLTYKTGERDGYFMLLAAPRVSIPKDRILPKQVVFVLDRTGSMAGEKIAQARKSLLFCLNSLHPQDRFDVITFNESPDLLSRQLQPATEAAIAKARRFVADIEASGGTNIDEALHAALSLLKNETGRQKMVVFLTDGLPTVGETDINTILRHVEELNGTRGLAERDDPAFTPRTRPAGLQDGLEWPIRKPQDGAHARIFCFGLGYDVNVPFLDRLADVGRGDSDYVKPEEDVEVKVSAFFTKVTSPILSNLRLAFDSADVYDIYPKVLPDLFKGTQLVITGRFRGEGGGTVRLAGLTNGSEEKFQMGTEFGAGEGHNAFLPRIWAARKLGYLIDQVRLSDSPAGKQEILDEIVRLSREYGIITEYTSFLVDEREQEELGLRSPSGMGGFSDTPELRQELKRRLGQFGFQGQGATDQSLRAKSFNNANQAASRYQSATGGVYALTPGPAGAAGPPALKSVTPAPGNFGGFFGGGAAGRGGGWLPRMAGGGGGGGYNGGPPGERGAETQVSVQAVADRTFYRQKDNVWQDHSYDPNQQTLIKIQAFSDAHFALLKAVPKLAAYSSVGDEVIVRLGKYAVQIGKEGKEKLTDTELKMLSGK